MTPRALKVLGRLSKVTTAACKPCPAPDANRCCGDFFCSAVEAGLKAIGEEVPTVARPIGGARFLSEGGCVIPPHLRPGCTGFVCSARITKKLAKRRDALLVEAAEDPDVDVLLRACTEASAAVARAMQDLEELRDG